MCNRSEITISLAPPLHLIEEISHENNSSVLQQSEKELLTRISQSTCVKLSELREVLKILSKKDGNKDEHLLHSLLRDSNIIFPSVATSSSSSSSSSSYNLEERRAHLLRRQEEREYARLVGDSVDTDTNSNTVSVSKPISEIKGQISIIANMFVCAFAMFGVGYYVGAQYRYDLQTRTIFGLIGAVTILFVEMLLYIIRAYNIDYAKYHDSHTNKDKKDKNENGRNIFQDRRLLHRREDEDIEDLYAVISATDAQVDTED